MTLNVMSSGCQPHPENIARAVVRYITIACFNLRRSIAAKCFWLISKNLFNNRTYANPRYVLRLNAFPYRAFPTLSYLTFYKCNISRLYNGYTDYWETKERKAETTGSWPNVSVELCRDVGENSAVKPRKRVYRRLTTEFDEIVNSFVRSFVSLVPLWPLCAREQMADYIFAHAHIQSYTSRAHLHLCTHTHVLTQRHAERKYLVWRGQHHPGAVKFAKRCK